MWAHSHRTSNNFSLVLAVKYTIADFKITVDPGCFDVSECMRQLDFDLFLYRYL